MPRKTVLLVIDKSASVSSLGEWIEAARDLDLHLSVLVAAIARPIPTTAFGGLPYGGIVVTEEWQNGIRADAEQLSAKVQEIETLFAQSEISADVQGTHG